MRIRIESNADPQHWCWIRSIRVIRAIAYGMLQQSWGHGFDSTILRHSGIWKAADEVLLTVVHICRILTCKLLRLIATFTCTYDLCFWCGQHLLLGQVGGSWALEIERFSVPVKWHRADSQRAPFGPKWISLRSLSFQQCCGTGNGTLGTVTFCLVEPEP
jgi:hypothetical protein